jgi:hypothetical protein
MLYDYYVVFEFIAQGCRVGRTLACACLGLEGDIVMRLVGAELSCVRACVHH